MDIIIALGCSAVALLYVVSEGVFIGYMLIFSYICFALVCLKREYSIKQIVMISWNSSKSSILVIQIFVLIGAIIGIWFASGTIPAMVYYALGYLNPDLFVLLCFMLCCVTSFLIGTSFGTCSVMGAALMVIASAGGANSAVVAGAVICGAYFGDRMSLMSGSAILVASVSKSDIMMNMKAMFKTGIVPTLLSILFFLYFSKFNAINQIEPALQLNIGSEFKVSLILLVPAAIVIIMAVMGKNIKSAMLISVAVSAAICIIIQRQSFLEVLRYIVFGFETGDDFNPLHDIMRGGGIVSMLKPALVVFVSTSLTGLLAKLRVTDAIKKMVDKREYSRYSIFLMTSLVSTISGMLGCNQSIAIIMTENIMRDAYERFNEANLQMAIDLENSAVPIAGLIPWSIASIVPATTVGVTPLDYIPYAFFLVAVPACYFVQLFLSDKIKRA